MAAAGPPEPFAKSQSEWWRDIYGSVTFARVNVQKVEELDRSECTGETGGHELYCAIERYLNSRHDDIYDDSNHTYDRTVFEATFARTLSVLITDLARPGLIHSRAAQRLAGFVSARILFQRSYKSDELDEMDWINAVDAVDIATDQSICELFRATVEHLIKQRWSDAGFPAGNQYKEVQEWNKKNCSEYRELCGILNVPLTGRSSIH